MSIRIVERERSLATHCNRCMPWLGLEVDGFVLNRILFIIFSKSILAAIFSPVFCQSGLVFWIVLFAFSETSLYFS